MSDEQALTHAARAQRILHLQDMSVQVAALQLDTRALGLPHLWVDLGEAMVSIMSQIDEEREALLDEVAGEVVAATDQTTDPRPTG